MMHEIYIGEFVSRADVRWSVAILQELGSAPATAGKLEFSGEEPLLIEWGETSKEDVVCGSSATLKVISPGDRTYAGLYTIKAGAISIRIEREGLLYWSGTLDPEFYEEPYTDNEDYEVVLTFSDFGIFERLQYDLSGMQTLEDILRDALCRARIGGELRQDWISTRLTADGSRISLGDLCVRSENFIDEDGEVSNLQEVLEGIMQPLGLRLVQRNGKIWVYDLNGIYQGAGTEKIIWHDDDQVMGVDKVANNIKVTFSPYASSKLLDGELEYGDVYGPDYVNRGNEPFGEVECYSYYPDFLSSRQGAGVDYGNINFTIFLSGKGSGLAYVNPSARYFHIQPMVGGPSAATGIAWGFYTGGHGALTTGWPQRKLNAVGKGEDTIVMRSNRAFIPRLGTGDRGRFYLRLALEMLLDARYNPFSEAKDNEEDNYNAFKVWTGWAFVPVGVTLYGSDGSAICHFCNRNKTEKSTQGSFFWSVLDSTSASGAVPAVSWEAGAAQFGDCWLAYYDPEDMKESAGILGWKKNRQNIGRPDTSSRIGYADGSGIPYSKGYFPNTESTFHMYESFKAMEDGEYIPYPEQGGFLEVVVYAGVRCFDYGESPSWLENPFNTMRLWDAKGLYDKVRWLLYKAPVLDIVKKDLLFSEAELEDVEYRGYINKEAKEEIKIETICGTVSKAIPTARGAYCLASDGTQVTRLTRQGRTDLAEKLLIGTLYSQFADRHTKLAGTASLMAGDLMLYTDGAQGSKKFIVLSDVQDLDADTSEMAAVELSPDEYDAIEYEED